jgi:hypothetical protein
MLPSDRQGITLIVELGGMWGSLAGFYHDAMRVSCYGSTPQPLSESIWCVIVSYMMWGQRKMLDSMFITHAESFASSHWVINLEWSESRITGQWRRASATPKRLIDFDWGLATPANTVTSVRVVEQQ